MIQDPPQGLVEAINNRHAFAFVASGLSRAAGGPSWERLLEDLLSYARVQASDSEYENLQRRVTVDIADKKYLDAADPIKNLLKPAGFAEAITSCFGRYKLKPTDSHHCLVALPWQVILTTNYDHLLEESGERNYRVYSYQHEEAHTLLSGAHRPYILKLHGDLDNADHIILARSDYSKMVANKAPGLRAYEKISGHFVGLFIGFGFDDTDSDYILGGNAHSGLRNGYALVDSSSPTYERTVERIRGMGAVPIQVKHSEIEEWLLRLVEKCGVNCGPLAEREAKKFVGELQTATLEVSAHYVAEKTIDRLAEILRGAMADQGWAGDRLPKVRESFEKKHVEMVAHHFCEGADPGEKIIHRANQFLTSFSVAEFLKPAVAELAIPPEIVTALVEQALRGN